MGGLPAVDIGRIHEAERRESAHADYVSSPEFAKLKAEALSKGFRKATLAEIHGSANSAPGAQELFYWRGGLWIKA